MPQYVLLQHDWNEIHFDFMLEMEGKLMTWQLPASIMQGQQNAIRIVDHRLEYLQYEGEISGNRGMVKRVARGNYNIRNHSVDSWEIDLKGDYQGHLKMIKQMEDAWLFVFYPAQSSAQSD